jgi:hypothetical protein
MRIQQSLLLAALMACGGCATAPAESPIVTGISEDTAQKIGKRVWQNECGGTVAGLTSWNDKENFASLGIGHFIWYPTGTSGPYEESFPAVIKHLQAKGVKLPDWLGSANGCPWPDMKTFHAQQDTVRMKELRNILANTVTLQVEVLTKRFLDGTKKIVAQAPAAQRKQVQQNIQNLAAVPAGLYGMMDYVNFKGEGTNAAERYQGTGWGLLQVLQEMKGNPEGSAATKEFSLAAQRTLERRIQLAPKENKKEDQWRAGWMSRCSGYAKPF